MLESMRDIGTAVDQQTLIPIGQNGLTSDKSPQTRTLLRSQNQQTTHNFQGSRKMLYQPSSPSATKNVDNMDDQTSVRSEDFDGNYLQEKYNVKATYQIVALMPPQSRSAKLRRSITSTISDHRSNNTSTIGTTTTQQPDEKRLVEVDASNLLSNDDTKLWLSSKRSTNFPQTLIFDLTQAKYPCDPKSFRFKAFGFRCWHAYTTNPNRIRISVSQSDTKNFLPWQTFTMQLRAGTQVCYLKQAIGAAQLKFVRIEILNTMGGVAQQTIIQDENVHENIKNAAHIQTQPNAQSKPQNQQQTYLNQVMLYRQGYEPKPQATKQDPPQKASNQQQLDLLLSFNKDGASAQQANQPHNHYNMTSQKMQQIHQQNSNTLDLQSQFFSNPTNSMNMSGIPSQQPFQQNQLPGQQNHFNLQATNQQSLSCYVGPNSQQMQQDDSVSAIEATPMGTGCYPEDQDHLIMDDEVSAIQPKPDFDEITDTSFQLPTSVSGTRTPFNNTNTNTNTQQKRTSSIQPPLTIQSTRHDQGRIRQQNLIHQHQSCRDQLLRRPSSLESQDPFNGVKQNNIHSIGQYSNPNQNLSANQANLTQNHNVQSTNKEQKSSVMNDQNQPYSSLLMRNGGQGGQQLGQDVQEGQFRNVHPQTTSSQNVPNRLYFPQKVHQQISMQQQQMIAPQNQLKHNPVNHIRGFHQILLSQQTGGNNSSQTQTYGDNGTSNHNQLGTQRNHKEMQILSGRTGFSGFTGGAGGPLSSPLTSNRTHFSTSQHPSQSVYQPYQTYQQPPVHHDGARQMVNSQQQALQNANYQAGIPSVQVNQGIEAYRRARNGQQNHMTQQSRTVNGMQQHMGVQNIQNPRTQHHGPMKKSANLQMSEIDSEEMQSSTLIEHEGQTIETKNAGTTLDYNATKTYGTEQEGVTLEDEQILGCECEKLPDLNEKLKKLKSFSADQTALIQKLQTQGVFKIGSEFGSVLKGLKQAYSQVQRQIKVLSAKTESLNHFKRQLDMKENEIDAKQTIVEEERQREDLVYQQENDNEINLPMSLEQNNFLVQKRKLADECMDACKVYIQAKFETLRNKNSQYEPQDSSKNTQQQDNQIEMPYVDLNQIPMRNQQDRNYRFKTNTGITSQGNDTAFSSIVDPNAQVPETTRIHNGAVGPSLASKINATNADSFKYLGSSRQTSLSNGDSQATFLLKHNANQGGVDSQQNGQNDQNLQQKLGGKRSSTIPDPYVEQNFQPGVTNRKNPLIAEPQSIAKTSEARRLTQTFRTGEFAADEDHQQQMAWLRNNHFRVNNQNVNINQQHAILQHTQVSSTHQLLGQTNSVGLIHLNQGNVNQESSGEIILPQSQVKENMQHTSAVNQAYKTLDADQRTGEQEGEIQSLSKHVGKQLRKSRRAASREDLLLNLDRHISEFIKHRRRGSSVHLQEQIMAEHTPTEGTVQSKLNKETTPEQAQQDEGKKQTKKLVQLQVDIDRYLKNSQEDPQEEKVEDQSPFDMPLQNNDKTEDIWSDHSNKINSDLQHEEYIKNDEIRIDEEVSPPINRLQAESSVVILDPNLASDYMTGRVQHQSPPTESDQDKQLPRSIQKEPKSTNLGKDLNSDAKNTLKSSGLNAQNFSDDSSEQVLKASCVAPQQAKKNLTHIQEQAQNDQSSGVHQFKRNSSSQQQLLENHTVQAAEELVMRTESPSRIINSSAIQNQNAIRMVQQDEKSANSDEEHVEKSIIKHKQKETDLTNILLSSFEKELVSKMAHQEQILEQLEDLDKKRKMDHFLMDESQENTDFDDDTMTETTQRSTHNQRY